MAKKMALLIGVSEYGAGIPPLLSALNDVQAMERVLQNPNLGNFAQVERLLNPDSVAMRIGIQKLFKNAGKEDLLLFYFSGHGITNDDNHLYLATRNTAKDNFEATAVDANFIQTQSKSCYSKRQVLILDACYSGAFANGWHTKSIGVDIKKQLGAEGRVVLTSSGATQTSFAQEGATLSLYTQYLVEGIETGAADTDNDGNIHVQELHTYAKSKVQAVKPNMTPDIILDKEGYNILLAYAPKNPEAEYRKLVEQYAKNGELKRIAIEVLKAKRKTLVITDAKAEEIETEVLEPFRRRLINLQSYKQYFAEEVEQQYPLDEHTLKILKDYQQDVLGLRDEDVESMELEITSVKEAEYQKQLQIQKQQEEEALQLQQQAKALSQLRLQQEVERLQRQREAEAAEQLRLQQEAERLQRQREAEAEKNKSGYQLKTFQFETAQINKNGTGIKRIAKSAEYFPQDLGNGAFLEMVHISGGTFIMGSPESEEGYRKSQSPQHQVTVPPFFMGKYPVTQKQWQAVAALEKVKIDLESDPSNFKGDNLPVERVSWNHAQEFCARLSQKTSKTYRLPSEAEWEYACRGGTTTPFYFGETISTDLANYDGSYTYEQGQKGEYRGKTTDVGIFPANPFGLYDMCGNVWEWCEDEWHENYINAPIDGSALTSLSSSCSALRGGSWVNYPKFCRSASRSNDWAERDDDFNYIGFRVVCAVGRTL
ncbi:MULTISPECIES: SUMF1/EgtB/PvdO family nonheme iron enzyme [Nostocales]|uniref:SUMF1/EgtB/PvdOfamily nonheme iron enzyme n=1 Tax=Dolichospermum flos-aquae UHCC 0037 TaxID=2590026 RepID=A0ACC7S1J1_DOLFA|nr:MULTISPECIES: SUMF1/EgtB/PvdO family nonheme iron enzyme [Nostocales]MBO1064180.1 SUMF1/EgtB/PvdO family nonheme iron enzyme [Anabaena sp. 54]MTJ42039.1 SUMF1/EgtB/PvdOfamily nonheme iron enzyme [Dolichospermum flos-aquae UHCC 0037]